MRTLGAQVFFASIIQFLLPIFDSDFVLKSCFFFRKTVFSVLFTTKFVWLYLRFCIIQYMIPDWIEFSSFIMGLYWISPTILTKVQFYSQELSKYESNKTSDWPDKMVANQKLSYYQIYKILKNKTKKNVPNTLSQSHDFEWPWQQPLGNTLRKGEKCC